MSEYTRETTRLQDPSRLVTRWLWLLGAFALGLALALGAMQGALDNEARNRPTIYAESGAEVHYTNVNVHACGVAILGCD